MRFHHLLAATLAFAVTISVSACASDDPVVSEDSTTTSAAAPSTTTDTTTDTTTEGREVEIDPTAQEPIIPVPLNSLEPGPDDRSVRLTVWGDPCTVIASVDVTESETEVVVSAAVGRNTASDVACIQIAELLSTTVTLDEALGGRTLADGYTP